MTYQHGITISEKSTRISPPAQSISTIAVVIGTAPINLAENPTAAVNKPIVAKTYDEAVKAVGFSSNYEKYTLCEAIDIFFKQFGVGPLVLINVLDPAKHKTDSQTVTGSIVNGVVIINTEGILLDNTFLVKDSTGTVTYDRGTDYAASFKADGTLAIAILKDGNIDAEEETLKITYTKLDPSKVTAEDIIGGYDSQTNTYKGIENIAQVYPRFNLVPSIIIAPGWSQIKEVEAVLKAKAEKINGLFNCTLISDIDSKTIKSLSAAKAWKENNVYTGKHEVVLWPKVKIGGNIYWYSTVLAALMVSTDIQNNDVPVKSPSNKKLPISSTVLADGTEVYLDQTQGNELNGSGIVTAINMAGWRAWGNNTGAYPDNTDLKDRFISIRRLFDWWGNQFIVEFFDKVDDPADYRLIESIIDEQNIKSNGYQAAGQIIGAKISFSKDENPVQEILNGHIKFTQSIAAGVPAESIENELSFDPTLYSNSLFGGEN